RPSAEAEMRTVSSQCWSRPSRSARISDGSVPRYAHAVSGVCCRRTMKPRTAWGSMSCDVMSMPSCSGRDRPGSTVLRPPVDHLCRAERNRALSQDVRGPVEPGPALARSGEFVDPPSIPWRRLSRGAVGGDVEGVDLARVDRITRAAQVSIEDDRGA